MMTHRIISYAQIILSALFLIGYFSVLVMFLLGYIRTPADWKDALTALLGVITAGVMQILGFWFARQRTNEPSAAP